MTRKEFMDELRYRLDRLPEDEREAALRYYEEYFDEAGADREAEVIGELGSPASIASRILADSAVKAVKSAPYNPKKGLSALWFVLLAIVAAPIALPAIIALVGLLVGAVGVFIAVAAVAIGLFVGGVGLFITGFVGLAASPAGALVMFGTAFLLWGLGKIIIVIAGALVSLVAQLIQAVFGRLSGGYHA